MPYINFAKECENVHLNNIGTVYHCNTILYSFKIEIVVAVCMPGMVCLYV